MVADTWWLTLMAMTMKLQTRRSRSIGGSHVEVTDSGVGNLDHEQTESESDNDRETTIVTRITKTDGQVQLRHPTV